MKDIVGLWILFQLVLVVFLLILYVVGAFAQLNLLWFMNVEIYDWAIPRGILACWWVLSAAVAVCIWGIEH